MPRWPATYEEDRRAILAAVGNGVTRIEHIGSTYTLTDLNSTNSTKLNGKRIEPDKAAPLNDRDTLLFGKVTATFKKA